MKYLIVLALLGLLFWKWHTGRGHRSNALRPGKQSAQEGTPMQACQLCGLHVPEPEAVHGQQGWYCCEAHRQRAEA